MRASNGFFLIRPTDITSAGFKLYGDEIHEALKGRSNVKKK